MKGMNALNWKIAGQSAMLKVKKFEISAEGPGQQQRKKNIYIYILKMTLAFSTLYTYSTLCI